jgi:hypothetical protein
MPVLPAGFVRKDGAKVRLYSRPGSDLTYRFPLIVEGLARLRSKSCIIDGEAAACDGNGMPTFDRIRYRGHEGSVFLYAFELIELNGDNLRTDSLEIRKATLANVLAKVVGERRAACVQLEHLRQIGTYQLARSLAGCVPRAWGAVRSLMPSSLHACSTIRPKPGEVLHKGGLDLVTAIVGTQNVVRRNSLAVTA